MTEDTEEQTDAEEQPDIEEPTVPAGGDEIEVEEPDVTFADLGIRPEVLKALGDLGYEEPTPIQREAIPPLLDGRDLIGQAATGTGKTAAFALPILEHVTEGRPAPIALVLVPTRELAMQVSEAIYKYGRDLGAQVLPIYGGQPIVRQLDAIRRGVHVVVATPGRAIDHLKRRSLPLDRIALVVLDEADEMLDMGFAEDIEAILEATPAERQTVLFSATMPPRIDAIARRHLREPVRIRIEAERVEAGEAPLVRQSAYVVARAHKPAALGRILDIESPAAALVFCRTRIEVDQLTETLNGRGYRAEALHGGMTQDQRDKVMARMRNGTAELLVATDVAARGLDLDQLTHVVNYDVPSAPEAYVHRIGRVGRAGREGVAITLAEPRERRLLNNIERVTKQRLNVEEVPTVADLRAKQMDATRDALRDALAGEDVERFAPVLDALADEFDLRQIALAAVQLAHEASGPAPDEKEIPAAFDKSKPAYDKHGSDNHGKGKPWKDKADKGGDKPWKDKKEKHDKGDKPNKGEKAKWKDKVGPERSAQHRGEPGEVTTLYVSVGRRDGVRPQDLVGAIAGETSLSGRDIGKISITERFSIVEVPAGSIDEVIADMARTTIKGKKAGARRDRD